MRTFGLMVLVGALGLAPVAEGKPRKSVQVVEGEVVVGDPNCYSPGTHRRLSLVAGEPANGINGYDFDVARKSWGGRFVLEVTGGSPITEYDIIISFFTEFGEPTDDIAFTAIDDMTGGEKGIVPPDTTKAIVSLCQGPNAHGTDPPVTLGFQAPFRYTSFAPKRR